MQANDALRPRHPIGTVAQRTGLTLEALRAWERRYAVVRPSRSEGGHRLYTDADVERLQRLRQATQLGWGIGAAAALPAEELASLVASGPAARPAAPESARLVEQALNAAAALDAPGVEAALRQAVMLLGPGSGTTRKPASRTAAARRAPGSLTAGVPASLA